MKHLAPTLGQKLDRLFAFYHHRDEPELTTQAVATLVGQRIGEPVTVELLANARAGDVESLPTAMADALCDLFGVDRDYLRLSGSKDIDIDQRLRLWTAIRDRGLNHFAARATTMTREDLEMLIAEVNRFPVQRRVNAS
ncbi:conserved protein of unknown function [Rhodococcus sp. RD6.2]|jgi:hypothetical protein|uniref:hypothetical protein n=1 Tax=Rhodococcus sp. RD6.2 TaxID=260936 RepID=UPI00063B61F0|nr:hypothetical protein [Rhodococcus sp. RD6.2]CRK54615.1 conserved protein of unknown function [Rhodococcus sp. RD6.2]